MNFLFKYIDYYINSKVLIIRCNLLIINIYIYIYIMLYIGKIKP